MGTMTKEDFRAQGEAAAVGEGRGRKALCALKAGTWQQKAWKEGFDLAKKRGKEALEEGKKAPDPGAPPIPQATAVEAPARERRIPGTNRIRPVQSELGRSALWVALEERRKARFAHWPGAAAEHLRQLALDVADETNIKRQERLMRAAGRMIKRYGPAKEIPHDFPVSTQPHPDGPITAGMLLEGR